MSKRTKKWLRGFLELGKRAEKDGIPKEDVARQEATVLRALDMLDRRPGIILADEVGMGKTYEALGIAAATRHQKPRSRIVVITPGPDLNTKWSAEFGRFQEMFDFDTEKNVRAARNLREFAQLINKHPIVVAPVTMFQSGRGTGDQTYLLSLYFDWKGLHGNTANAIMKRFQDGDHDRVNVKREQFLDMFDLKKMSSRFLSSAFRRGRSGGTAGLDDLYQKGGYDAFENSEAVRNALYRARFVLTGKVIPTIDLLIVDEAHKLKNPGSLRTQAMRHVFDNKFRNALFLTATPFQLDVEELREVFSLFLGAKDASPNLETGIEELLGSVKDYQEKYEVFQQTWSELEDAEEFRQKYGQGANALDDIQDPNQRKVADQVSELKRLKNKSIEPGFRKWMIRSLRKEKRNYRNRVEQPLRAVGTSALPFLIYERYIAELFRHGRQTHKAAVEINMVSSHAAAQESSIISSPINGAEFDETELTEEELINAQAAKEKLADAERYRGLMQEMLGEIQSGSLSHPKVANVIDDVFDKAANHDEKTLIFCSRIATLRRLRNELSARWIAQVLERWKRVYPDEGADDIFDQVSKDGQGGETRIPGRRSRLQTRFNSPQYVLYLALREPYLRTLGSGTLADQALKNINVVVDKANEVLSGLRLNKASAESVDYKVAKRCVGHAVAHLFLGNAKSNQVMRSLLDEKYLSYGLDLKKDDYEEDQEASPDGMQPRWKIKEREVRMIIGEQGSLWDGEPAEILAKLTVDIRVGVVEQLARYLTNREVPFLADLLLEAKNAGVEVDAVISSDLLRFMPKFWRTDAGKQWKEHIQTFLRYFQERDETQQKHILNGPIKTGNFARHTSDGESRERLREAFNTPLFPMILIANEVMQEGLDLHKHCGRIVHHDLAWNPAQIEQRIGRIDRLGSLTDRRRKDNNKASLDVLYPVIHGTLDERLYKTVKDREKWLEFLLGAPPNFSEYSLDDKKPPELPEQLAQDLAIDLRPR